MAISKQKKVEIYDAITERVKGSGSVVFVNFHGLKVAETDAVRRSLRAKGLGYLVAKKSLIRRALTDMGVTGTLPELNGEVAIAYGKDAVLPAKEIAAFTKTYKERFSVLGGLLEGKYLASQEVVALSKVPSREVLLGKLLNVMQSPISGFVGVLNGVPRSFVGTLDQIAKQKSNS